MFMVEVQRPLSRCIGGWNGERDECVDDNDGENACDDVYGKGGLDVEDENGML